jgi:hypothetical protein
MSKRPKREARQYNCLVKVELHESDEQIMENAAKLGQWTGRDGDWRPETLNEAVAEIILISDGPLDHGVEIIDY